ncbi:unnamed protein product [Ixodes pacificus]
MTQLQVVIWTESWLDDNDLDREVFPDNYSCYRKDRNSRGGSVLILVHKSIVSKERQIETENVANVWCELSLTNGKLLAVGAFYRPSGTLPCVLRLLSEIVSVTGSAKTIIRGAFNLRAIERKANNQRTGVGRELYTEFFSLVDLCSLEQHVFEPMRNDETGHILDFHLTNTPGIISNTHVIPGISDHKVVVADVYLANTNVGRSKSRKVFLYTKTVCNGMSSAV